MALLLHPELITKSAPYAVDIEADSELTRGYSAMSWGAHGLKPNAHGIEAVDATACFEYIKETMATPTTPSQEIVGLKRLWQILSTEA